jgi:hypothetical protein
MKKIGAILFAIALSGCGTAIDMDGSVAVNTLVDWQSNSRAFIAGETVTLTSYVWINKMPSPDDDSVKAHATLRLTSPSFIAPETDILQVVIRQGNKQWDLTEEEYELRADDSDSWEIAAAWNGELNHELPVDLAVEVSSIDTESKWLVQEAVNVDEVF